MNTLLNREFALDEDLIHLNHAAVAPWPRRTVDAVNRFAMENMHQGSWRYPEWLQVEATLRAQIATLINAASGDDIALVKNTSEALSFVAAGVEWRTGENIVTSDEEFPSNRIVWETLSAQGVELRQAELSNTETPEDALFALVDENTRMIAISSVQYASGLAMDLRRIGRFCHEHDILFCVDAIQSVGAIPFDARAIYADFVAADGHKWMLGPEGLGFFYVRPELRKTLKLSQFGWHMVENVGDFEKTEWQPADSARRFECGSPNMLSIHALSASLSLLHEVGMDAVGDAVVSNSRFLFAELSALPGVELVTPTENGRFAGIVSFRVAGRDNAEIQQHLHSERLFCAHRGGAIRFSPHFYTPLERLERAITILNNTINQ